MSPKLFDEPPPIPDFVKDESVTVPRGEVTYTIDLDDEMVELLAAGVCPEDVSRICFGLLKWKREHARNEARRSA